MGKTSDKVIKLLEKILPRKWEKVCFVFELSDMAYTGDFYVYVKDDPVPKRACDIISDDKLLKIYDKIFPILLALRKEQEKFSHYLLEFDKSSVNEHFDYLDIDSDKEDNDYDFYSYWLKWKSKYVK